MEWFIYVIKSQYINFQTRASRREFWTFILYSILFRMLFIGIDIVLELYMGVSPLEMITTEQLGTLTIGYFALLYDLMILLPMLGIMVRRLHDTNKSGWLLVTPFIPLLGFIGLIYIFVCWFSKGDQGENQYGQDPVKVQDIGYEEL